MIPMVRLCPSKSLRGLLGGLTALLLTVTFVPDGFAADEPSETPKPRAVAIQRIHSFGSVVEGIDIKHDFIIENRGSGELVIHKVEPS